MKYNKFITETFQTLKEGEDENLQIEELKGIIKKGNWGKVDRKIICIYKL